MSTLRFALRAVMFTGALLASQTTLASDITTEQQQASAQRTSQATDQRASAKPLERSRPAVSAAQTCDCCHSTQSSRPGSAAEEEELNRLRWQNG